MLNETTIQFVVSFPWRENASMHLLQPTAKPLQSKAECLSEANIIYSWVTEGKMGVISVQSLSLPIQAALTPYTWLQIKSSASECFIGPLIDDERLEYFSAAVKEAQPNISIIERTVANNSQEDFPMVPIIIIVVVTCCIFLAFVLRRRHLKEERSNQANPNPKLHIVTSPSSLNKTSGVLVLTEPKMDSSPIAIFQPPSSSHASSNPSFYTAPTNRSQDSQFQKDSFYTATQSLRTSASYPADPSYNLSFSSSLSIRREDDESEECFDSASVYTIKA